MICFFFFFMNAMDLDTKIMLEAVAAVLVKTHRWWLIP